MEQDIKALETIAKYAIKGAKNSNDRITITKYNKRLHNVLTDLKPRTMFKIMIVRSDGKKMWGKECIGHIKPVENERDASLFTEDEAENIKTQLMQNGKIRIYRVVGND